MKARGKKIQGSKKARNKLKQRKKDKMQRRLTSLDVEEDSDFEPPSRVFSPQSKVNETAYSRRLSLSTTNNFGI